MYGIIVLAIYALVMIGATILISKRSKSQESFHVADRKISTVAAAFSVAANWIWAPALFVSAERAYVNGIPGLFWFTVPNVLCLLIFIPFAKKIRKIYPSGITLSAFMGQKYKSGKVKGIYQFQLVALAVLSTSVQLLAGSKILSLATGIPFWALTIVLVLIAFSCSQFSGLKSSVMTDILKIVCIFAGCALIVPLALKSTGGISTLLNGLNGRTGDFSSLWSAKGIEVFLAFGLSTTIGLTSGPFGDQSFWQRTFAIKEKSIGKAFAIGAALFVLVPLAMGTVGYLAAGSGFIAKDSSMVNFEFIKATLPAWVLVPFLFIVISGLLSIVNSNLCSAASITTDRIKQETAAENIKTSKLVMLALMLIAVAIANIPGLTVTHLFLFYGTLRASTMLPTILTLKGKKLSGNSVFIGILASLLVGLPVFAYGNLMNVALYKTIGSLTTVLLSGILSVALRRWEGQKCKS